MKKNLTVLGSTGSIGVNTLDIVARHADRVAITSHGEAVVATDQLPIANSAQ